MIGRWRDARVVCGKDGEVGAEVSDGWCEDDAYVARYGDLVKGGFEKGVSGSIGVVSIFWRLIVVERQLMKELFNNGGEELLL